ncbi:hypothetical protein PIB30_052185 [Stylosanthes scabra]|uniref:Uncharacterized protein n=1 Tax=Stylosanthes scabra TaxID=79078 RepID=A0ABU6UHJ9_9FABA|nr:hypothetical protein [Stylosanthes scabra]
MARRKSRVSIELGVQGSESTPSSRFHKLPRIESSRLTPEPIRFHTGFQFNVQNALRIDSYSSESILMSYNVILRDELTKDEIVTSHV